MRAGLSIIAAGGAVALAAVAVLAPLAWAEPRLTSSPDEVRPVIEPPRRAVAVRPSDAELRADLSRRLQSLAREGRGPRLKDPVGPRAARRVDPVRPAARRVPARMTTTTNRSVERARSESNGAGFVSTITPPPVRGFRLADLGGPRLDLKTPAVVPSDPIECLTQAIYYEARSESEEGQAAVAAVVMNRARSGRYPGDVCQVVYQRNSRTCQFTFTCDGAIGRRPVNMTQWARAERIAREVHEGRSTIDLPSASVNYHADYVRPSWGARLEQVRKIGAHIFYGAPRAGFSNPGAADKPANERPAPRGLEFVYLPELQRAAAPPVETR